MNNPTDVPHPESSDWIVRKSGVTRSGGDKTLILDFARDESIEARHIALYSAAGGIALNELEVYDSAERFKDVSILSSTHSTITEDPTPTSSEWTLVMSGISRESDTSSTELTYNFDISNELQTRHIALYSSRNSIGLVIAEVQIYKYGYDVRYPTTESTLTQVSSTSTNILTDGDVEINFSVRAKNNDDFYSDYETLVFTSDKLDFSILETTLAYVSSLLDSCVSIKVSSFVSNALNLESIELRT
ncbi:hypothetical protein EB796_013569 [Bugula neritina]|uniref:Uncharacterized protein n=1 Tax=Bugula neritina TaxID=10212 RepID=A0A7J7JRS1_BUGNE|nr:hypothetical protein EB796_013569 [Bugula neritina]